MSTRVSLFPAVSTSDSLKVIFPGMSMSKRCSLRCVAKSLPSGENRSEVLWYFFVSGTYSGMLPPRIYAFDSDARDASS